MEALEARFSAGDLGVFLGLPFCGAKQAMFRSEVETTM